MSSWLKAGLIGGAALALISLLLVFSGGLGLECTLELLTLLAFAGIGVLAAYWMPPVRKAGPAAGQGALAAMLAQLIGGVVFTILTLIRSFFIDTAALISAVDPELLDQMVAAGLDPDILETLVGPVGAVLSGSMCCVGGLLFAAILGAIGGALLAAIRPESDTKGIPAGLPPERRGSLFPWLLRPRKPDHEDKSMMEKRMDHEVLDDLDLDEDVTCPECGAEMDPDETACPQCGAEYGFYCPECDEEIPADATVCPHCGAELDEGFEDDDEEAEYGFYCPECDEEIAEDATVCPHCGAELDEGFEDEDEEDEEPEEERAAFCGNCGEAIFEDDEECPSCGVDLCPDCGSPLAPDADACAVCGAEFTFSCPECGEDLAADDDVCPHCGYAFDEEDEDA